LEYRYVKCNKAVLMFLRSIFCLLLTTQIFASSLQAKSHKLDPSILKTKITKAKNSRDYSELGHFLKMTIRNQKKLNKLKQLTRKFHDVKLNNAINFASEIERQKDTLPIYAGELIEIALFIETKLARHIREGNYFLSNEATGTRFALEYDPQTKQCFLVLKGIRRTFLGRGASKTANKSILFHPTKPEIVVRLEQTRPYERELGFLNDVKGLEGLYKTRAFTVRQDGDICYFAIYADLYNPGSLGKMQRNGQAFRLSEKAAIAYGLVKGLSSLHRKGIIHRDIKPTNCLVNIAKSKHRKKSGRNTELTAVIADFGSGRYAEDAVGTVPNIGLTNTSPEGLFYTELTSSDYYATDVFALGTLLYKIYYKHLPPWKIRKYYTHNPEQFEEKYSQLVKQINASTKARRVFLANKKGSRTATCKDRLEYEILKMVHPDPMRRGTAKKHANELFRIYQRFK
jgi:serine/threonine protein kinase